MPLVEVRDWGTTLGAAVADGSSATVRFANQPPAELRKAGHVAIFRIDDEWFLGTDFTVASPYDIPVARGFGDTPPTAHASGASVDFVTDLLGSHTLRHQQAEGGAPMSSFGWDTMSWPEYLAGIGASDTVWLANGECRAIEVPHPGPLIPSHVGYVVRSTAASGLSASSMALMTWLPGEGTKLTRESPANTDIASYLTAGTLHQVPLTWTAGQRLRWVPGARLWVAMSITATTMPAFRNIGMHDLLYTGGGMRINPYPASQLSNGAVATGNTVGWGGNLPWFGVRGAWS